MFLDRRIGRARLKMGINASVSLFFQPKSPPTLNLLKQLFSLLEFYLAHWILQPIPKLPIQIYTGSPKGGFKSEDAGEFLHLQHKYSKSLS